MFEKFEIFENLRFTPSLPKAILQALSLKSKNFSGLFNYYLINMARG